MQAARRHEKRRGPTSSLFGLDSTLNIDFIDEIQRRDSNRLSRAILKVSIPNHSFSRRVETRPTASRGDHLAVARPLCWGRTERSSRNAQKEVQHLVADAEASRRPA